MLVVIWKYNKLKLENDVHAGGGDGGDDDDDDDDSNIIEKSDKVALR